MAIYVDLDGTLAKYNGWKGPENIGEPVPAICDETWEVYFGVNPRKDELMETE